MEVYGSFCSKVVSQYIGPSRTVTDDAGAEKRLLLGKSPASFISRAKSSWFKTAQGFLAPGLADGVNCRFNSFVMRGQLRATD